MPNLDFEKEQVGLETLKDLERKQVLDAFTCVECGRCQVNCPAHATGKRLNPKTLILQGEDALLAGSFETKLADIFDPNVLWQCTTCGACENQCPVGVEHLPLIIGARRGLVSNGDAPDTLGAVFNHLERRGNIWGLGADQRQKFVASAGVEIFDAARHDYLVWLGCAGSFEADFQKALRSLFAILRSRGDHASACWPANGARATSRSAPATSTSSRNWPTPTSQDFTAAGVTKIVTACPHCLRTIGVDYQAFGFKAEVVHAVRAAWRRSRATSPCRRPRRSRSTTRATSGAMRGSPTSPAICSRRFGADGRRTGALRARIRSAAAPAAACSSRNTKTGTRISQERLEQLHGDRRGDRRDGLPLLHDHAEGRPGQRERADRVRRHR